MRKLLKSKEIVKNKLNNRSRNNSSSSKKKKKMTKTINLIMKKNKKLIRMRK